MQFRIIMCVWVSLIAIIIDAHTCPHFGKVLLEHARAKQDSGNSVKEVNSEQTPAVPLPDSFGKTHFIVGASAEQVKQDLQQMPNDNSAPIAAPVTNENFNAHAFFSPDDGLESKLVDLIAQEQDSMKIAVFLFTNGAIAQALLDAQKRGINIEIITDSSCLQDKFNKITMLHDAGIKIHIYKPETVASVMGNRMHHKYIIFGKNKEGKRWLWFGSFNLTKSADLYNQEGVVLVDNHQLIDQFEKQFDLLKKRSINYKKSIMSVGTTLAAARPARSIKRTPKKIQSDRRASYVTA